METRRSGNNLKEHSSLGHRRSPDSGQTWNPVEKIAWDMFSVCGKEVMTVEAQVSRIKSHVGPSVTRPSRELSGDFRRSKSSQSRQHLGVGEALLVTFCSKFREKVTGFMMCCRI